MSATAIRWNRIVKKDPTPETKATLAEKPTKVLVIALGHTQAELAEIVEQLALQQVVSPTFEPAFLTDRSDASVIRRHGWIFEYVASYDEWCRFHAPSGWISTVRRRLATMVSVVEPDLLLQLSSQAARVLTGPLTLEAANAIGALRQELEAPAVEPIAATAELRKRRELERSVRQLKERVKELEQKERNRRAAERVIDLVRPLVPKGTVVLMVAKGDPALARIPGLEVWPFPQAPGGVYAGYNPSNSSEAIGHLEALRARGAQYLVFPRAYQWWLEHYEGLRDHLDSEHRRVLDHPDCVLFSLTGDRTAGR